MEVIYELELLEEATFFLLYFCFRISFKARASVVIITSIIANIFKTSRIAKAVT